MPQFDHSQRTALKGQVLNTLSLKRRQYDQHPYDLLILPDVTPEHKRCRCILTQVLHPLN